MREIVLVGLGGLLGSILRFALGTWVQQLNRDASFPYATLLINVAGCTIIGILAGLTEFRGPFSSAAKAFLFIGLLGGFTTYSAFGLETWQLLEAGRARIALLSVLLQVGLGISAVWFGVRVARMSWPVVRARFPG